MATFKGENRMTLTKVEAWLDPNGRWHVVSDDPDLRGPASEGLHLSVRTTIKAHDNLNAAYKRLIG